MLATNLVMARFDATPADILILLQMAAILSARELVSIVCRDHAARLAPFPPVTVFANASQQGARDVAANMLCPENP